MDIILASHGHLASGMKSAVEMITKDTEFIYCYDLDTYETPYAILNELQGKKDCIIITDIFGGSINNTLLNLMNANLLITGMNLGLVLELCFHRNDECLEEYIETIITESNHNICFVNRAKENFEGSDDLWWNF